MSVRTRRQVRMDPTSEELRDKAFEARKAAWTAEDAEEEKELATVGKTLDDTLLATVPKANEQKEDQARLFCKILDTFDYPKYFAVEETRSILFHLLEEFTEYAQSPIKPSKPKPVILNAPLTNIKEMVGARRVQIGNRVELLVKALNELQIDVVDWGHVFSHYKSLALLAFKELMDTCLFCRYYSGEALQEQLKVHEDFFKEHVIPALDMFMVEVRDSQYLQPVLFETFHLREREQPVVEPPGKPDKVQEFDQSEELAEDPIALAERLRAVRLKKYPKTEDLPSATTMSGIYPKPEASGQFPREIYQTKTEGINLQEQILEIMSLQGITSEEKAERIAQLQGHANANPSDDLDKLADKFNFKVEETGAAAYGDDKALAQYNTLPNVYLPPFFGNPLEFAKWWQMFTYLVDKNPKIPQIMKLI